MIQRSLILALVLTSPGFAQAFSSPAWVPIQPPMTWVYDHAGERPVVADFNADGLPDVVLTDNNGIRVALGDGAGGFLGYVYTPVPPLNPSGTSLPLIVGVSDLNGDGWPDVLANASGGIRTFLNLGGAAFAMSAASVASVPWAWHATSQFAELDGAPPEELVIAGADPFAPATWVIRVYSYDVMADAFSLIQTFAQPIYEGVVGLACGDFNGDGLRDIASVGYPGWPGGALGLATPPFLRVLVNGGGLTFTPAPALAIAPPPGFPFGTSPHYGPFPCSAGDVTGDGIADLVFEESLSTVPSSCAVWIYPGSPATGFGPSTVRVQPSSAYSAASTNDALADFDDDGIPEISVGYDIYRTLPAFSIALLSVDGSPSAGPRAVGDMNLDGTPDVVFLPSFMNASGNQQVIHVGAALNRSRLHPSCGLPTTFSIGTPNPGNPAFAFTLAGALPNALAVLGLSTAQVSASVPWCTVRIDASPASLVLPTASGLGILTTNPSGSASLVLPIPNIPGIAFTPFFAQWFIQDPNGPLPAGPGLAFSSSITRMIVAW